jgi:hypothetical protein
MSDQKQFGIAATQTLVTVPVDDLGEPDVGSLAPHPRPDDWTAPVVVPLIKLDQPDVNPATHRCTPVLVWFPDRVERQWVSTPLTDEELATLARKTWPNASAFLGEFTMPELAAISLSLDPTIAALRLLLASWPADVWSDDPRIIMGLDALETAGIITEARRGEIVAK